MRTSHLKIKARIRDAKSKISDKELFSSPEYGAFLTDITEKMCNKYGRRAIVVTDWDESDEADIAFTSGKRVYLNCGNEMTRSLPTRILRAASVDGLHAHELGHIFYTSFTMLSAFKSSILGGKLYPSDPTKLNEADSEALEKLKAVLESDDKPKRYALKHIAVDLWNILEDSYVEERMCYNYPGLRFAIQLNRTRFSELSRPIAKLEKILEHRFTVMRSVICLYATSHTVNDLGGCEGPYLERLSECIPIIDSVIYNQNAKSRFEAVNRLILKNWDYISEYLDSFKEEAEKHMKKTETEMSESEAESLMDGILSELDAGGIRRSKTPEGTTAGVREGYKPDKSESKKERAKEHDKLSKLLPKPIPKDGDKDADGKAPAESDDSFEKDFDYKGSGFKESADELERMLTDMATKKVYTEVETEIKEDRESEAVGLDYGALGTGMKTTLYRKTEFSEGDIEAYNRIAPELIRLAREMAKKVMQVIKDIETGAKRSGLYMGKRFDVGAVVRGDGRLFYNRKSPCEDAQIAVVILDDESGSMGTAERAVKARAASIIIYLFCKLLRIPVSIIGHSADQKTRKSLELYSYADFDSVDGNDKYRLMDIRPRRENRDDAALKFACDMLSKRPEQYKLLFAISDGAPLATGYGGKPAEDAMRQVLRQYARKGVITFGAAIGSDREKIKRIYGEEFFLDVTDLNELPRNISDVIAKYVRRSA